MRGREFLNNYGVAVESRTLNGVVVLDENDQVLHSQLVADIVQEPEYDAAALS